MATYYRWICKERKEYFDPGHIPNGPDEDGNYSTKYGSIHHSAWAVADLALDRWARADIRLISDPGDLYDESEESYLDVSDITLRGALLEDHVPENELRFLVVQAGLMTHEEAHGKDMSTNDVRDVLLKKFASSMFAGR